MQWDFDVRQLFMFIVEEICMQATKNRLMANNKNVLLTLKLHHNWFQSQHYVPIWLSASISRDGQFIGKLVRNMVYVIFHTIYL